MKDKLLEPAYFVDDGETQWLYVILIVDNTHKLTRIKLHNVGEDQPNGSSWSCQLKVFRSTLVAEIAPEVPFFNGRIITKSPWRPEVKVVESSLVHKITNWIALVNGPENGR